MRKLDPTSRPFTAIVSHSIQIRAIAIIQQPQIILALLTLLALVLRLYKLRYSDYWDDEVISTFLARVPASEIFTSVMVNDVHPPLYHILLHVWISGVGESLYTIRLLSVLISTACVPVVYLLGRQLATQPVALVAAALMAIAPFQVYHGQQARMYPLLTLIVLLTTILFVRAWRRGDWWAWLGVGLCTTAGLYTHVYFPFSVLALNLWALYDTWRQRRINMGQWARLIGAQLLGVVLFLPFMAQMVETTSRISQGFWIKPGAVYLDWMYVLVSLVNNYSVSVESEIYLWYILIGICPAILTIILTLVYSIHEMRYRSDERPVWLLLHMLIWTPIVVATILSIIFTPIILDRSLVGISSALFLLIAWVFIRYWSKRLIQITAVLFVISSFLNLAYAYPNAPRQNSLVRMADYFAEHWQPGDAFVVADWQSFDTTVLIQPELPDLYLLPGPDLDPTYWQRRAELMRWHSPQNIRPVADFAPDYRRVWLVFSQYTYGLDYHQEVNQGWLEQHGQFVQKLDFDRAVVLVYEVDP